MRFLTKSRIALSLTIIFTILGVFLLIAGVTSTYLVYQIDKDFSASINRTNIALLGMQIRSDSQEMVALAFQYISVAYDDAHRAALRDEIRVRRMNLDQYIAQAVELTAPDDLEERTDLAHIQQHVVNLSLQTNRLVEAFDKENGLGELSTALLLQLSVQYEQPLRDEVTAFLRYENERALLVQENARRKASMIYAILG